MSHESVLTTIKLPLLENWLFLGDTDSHFIYQNKVHVSSQLCIEIEGCQILSFYSMLSFMSGLLVCLSGIIRSTAIHWHLQLIIVNTATYFVMFLAYGFNQIFSIQLCWSKSILLNIYIFSHLLLILIC